ncbi:MAG: hypothetical protein RIE86_23080 [Imperialibacter sp.]|uniref:hypothetical protein n=1 Tax=Imperialibacter sp. TaxID=2038411 RepID=UPI0032F072F1
MGGLFRTGISKEDRNNLWFALALAQWECKALDSELLNRVRTIIETGEDIEIWKNLGASKQDLTKRQKALEKFWDKLNSEKKSPRKRKKKVFRDSIFKKGDCLSIALEDGKFGAAYVLESEQQTEYGMNLVAVCNYLKNEPPTTTFFQDATVLISKMQESRTEFKDYPIISWCMAVTYKSSKSDIRVVGNIKVSKSFDTKNDFRTYSPWLFISAHLASQPNLVKTHGPTKLKIQLNELR